MPRFPFKPREQQFFDLFEQSANNTVKAAYDLQNMIYHFDDVEKSVARIIELEHQGDIITHEIMAKLHRTFVTPFDREDIALLAHSLDDGIDVLICHHCAALESLFRSSDVLL